MTSAVSYTGSFDLYVFALFAVAKGRCMEASSVVVCGWARPRFFVVLLDWRRNANLAGGFAARLVLFFLLCGGDLICLRFGTGQLCQVSLFSPLMIFQDRATEHLRPNSRKKKNLGQEV